MVGCAPLARNIERHIRCGCTQNCFCFGGTVGAETVEGFTDSRLAFGWFELTGNLFLGKPLRVPAEDVCNFVAGEAFPTLAWFTTHLWRRNAIAFWESEG